MARFLFRLETTEGVPAEPPRLESAVPNWGPGHTWDAGRSPCLASGLTMPTDHRCSWWRTCLNERVAPWTDVS